MGVEGDPGLKPIWDYTTWQQAKDFPGAIQVGLGKTLLQDYPWHRFEPHPEWSDHDCFAAGIPGDVRFIYRPNRSVYDWSGPRLKQLELDGTRMTRFTSIRPPVVVFVLGTIMNIGDCPSPFHRHTEPLLLETHRPAGHRR